LNAPGSEALRRVFVFAERFTAEAQKPQRKAKDLTQRAQWKGGEKSEETLTAEAERA
jgi:hypothetical protein